MYARVLTWYTILRISLEERLVYRGDFALGTLMRFLPIVTQVFLWSAVFEASKNTNHGVIAGYSYQDFVAYYLLTMVVRAFSSMPGLASLIANQVRSGDVKKYLTQPVDMLGYLFLGRVAHKLAYYSVAFLPFALVFFLCRGYFDNVPSDPLIWLAFIYSLLLAFGIGFYLEASLGLVSFWFLEVSSLVFVYMLLSFFLSGHMFPLDMLPEPWHTLVDWLPLKYLAFFPSAVFLGKVTGTELVINLVAETLWLGFFILLSRQLFNAGVRRYSAFGG